MKDEGKYLTAAEVVKITGYKPSTVTNWCFSKRLKAEKVNGQWHIHPEDLEAFLEEKDEKMRLFNYSYDAVKKTRDRTAAGTLTRVTEKLMADAEEIVQKRRRIVLERFPNGAEPGEIQAWLLEHMPTGTTPLPEKSKLIHL